MKLVSFKNWLKLHVAFSSILLFTMLRPNYFRVIKRAFPITKVMFPCIKIGVVKGRGPYSTWSAEAPFPPV